MRKDKIIIGIRWVIFFLALLFLPIIAFYVSGMIAAFSMMGLLDGNSLSIPASLVSFTTAIVSILTAFAFAPKHKKEIVWIVFFIGCVALVFCCNIILQEKFFSSFQMIIPLVLTAIIPSFLMCIYFQRKTDKKQTIFNSLDENFINENN